MIERRKARFTDKESGTAVVRSSEPPGWKTVFISFLIPVIAAAATAPGEGRGNIIVDPDNPASSLAAPIPAAGVFKEVEGCVVLEAEHPTRWNRGWEKHEDLGASGLAYVMSTRKRERDATLDYVIEFQTTGVYRVWLRCRSTSHEDNDCYISCNGGPAWLPGDDGPLPVSGIKTNHLKWGWDSQAKTESDIPVTLRRRGVFIDVKTPGEHVLQLGSRASGFKVDKIVLIHERFAERPDGGVPMRSGSSWPGKEWPTVNPEAAGMSPSRTEAYLSWLKARAGGEPFGTVLVLNGAIAVEYYGSGATSESRWEIGSIRKAVSSALLGMAIDEKRLTLDTAVCEEWPAILESSNREEDRLIRVEHLFNSTSGWKRPEPPGSRWVYNNAAFTAGEMVLSRAFGLPDDRIAPLAQARIADPIGASSWRCYHYPEDFSTSHGNPGPKLAIDSTLRDVARFGYLWLRQGVWNGNQVIPRRHVADATRNQAAAAGGHYGFCWFTNDGKALLPAAPADAFFHVGNGRDRRRTVLAVVPSKDLVAVVGTHADRYDITRGYTSRPVPNVNEWIGRIFECFADTADAEERRELRVRER